VRFSTSYIFFFTAGLCFFCALMISIPAVALRERQVANQLLDQRKSILLATRLASPDERLTAERVDALFENIEARIIDIETGEITDIDPATFDESEVDKLPVAPNIAQVRTKPRQVQIFKVFKDGEPDLLVLPIYGRGLWSTLYGYLAVERDVNTVRGITYYQHGETPGLGGEVDNPRWKARWPGRQVFDADGNVQIEVIKGAAGSITEDPHRVDGLAGATITARGVTAMLHFWMGEEGFGPFLDRFREEFQPDPRSI